jgi:hypothetical protein
VWSVVAEREDVEGAREGKDIEDNKLRAQWRARKRVRQKVMAVTNVSLDPDLPEYRVRGFGLERP